MVFEQGPCRLVAPGQESALFTAFLYLQVLILIRLFIDYLQRYDVRTASVILEVAI